MRLLKSKLYKSLRKLTRDESGQFAVVMALVGVPMVAAVGLAVETTNTVAYKKGLKSTLDTAALAAVIPANLTDKERKEYAERVFFENYNGHKDAPITLDITATRNRVDIKLDTTTPTYIGGIVGIDDINFTVESAAALTQSNVVCLFALDPKGRRSIEFTDNAMFSSPACTVQTNSTHGQAMYSNSRVTPVAKAFCSSGGSSGNYEPYIKNNCTPLEDPYANLKLPKASGQCDNKKTVVRGGNESGEGAEFLESELNESLGDTVDEEEVLSFSTLSPGTYCKGLKIKGANVKLLPGIYHVWGDLTFTKDAGVVGDGVTFILKGRSGRLLIKKGAEVNLRAPNSGPTEGLVFWQKYIDYHGYYKHGKDTPSPNRVVATSEIRSGGGLEILGTAYLPDHQLLIGSHNEVASKSPATSIIARRIRFENRANVEIRVNHEEAGVPPLLPRSDDSARLVK